MAKVASSQIAAEFPEFASFCNLLDVSKITWKEYGISAADLADMDGWQREMLLIKLGF